MTVLRCACGQELEGTGESLLDAVEAHLDDAHRGRIHGDAGAHHAELPVQHGDVDIAPGCERVIRGT